MIERKKNNKGGQDKYGGDNDTNDIFFAHIYSLITLGMNIVHYYDPKATIATKENKPTIIKGDRSSKIPPSIIFHFVLIHVV